MHRLVSRALPLSLVAAVAAHAQQIEMFPPGPYVSHCRALMVSITSGGDDDHNNVYFVEVDPALADGTSQPDFFIHLWDGDNNATGTLTGTQDWDPMNAAGNDVFEYRLYGGMGAATNDEGPPGQDPTVWSGVLIDIDSDPNDDTLRTDDPDDNDNNSPEDLRDQGFSLIGVDIDGDPGELVIGLFVYKFVVDGSLLSGGSEWNRYEVQFTRDAGRTDPTGVHLYVFELTYAGRPASLNVWTNIGVIVPDTATDQIDIQTLDLDRTFISGIKSQVTTQSTFYPDAQTYESDDQFVSSAWMWTSINQQVPYPQGDGITGAAYSTTGEEGTIWTLDFDPGSPQNPFSTRLMDVNGGWLKLRHEPVFLAYGSGPIDLSGTGLPKAGGAPVTMSAVNAPPSALGAFLFSPAPAQLAFPQFQIIAYIDPTFATQYSLWFDNSGQWSQSFAVPAGMPATFLYCQAFALDVPNWPALGSVQHSNGLRVRIIP